MEKRITLATIKAFIRNNRDHLYIRRRSSFDGMTDCVESESNPAWIPCSDGPHPKYDLGIAGAWFVRGSRDYFTRIEDNGFEGFRISNCCGSFDLAVRK